MPWIKIKGDFYNNPKVSHLADKMGWTNYHAAGFLCHFWDWILTHNDSGDLTDTNFTTISKCLGIDIVTSETLYQALKDTGWVDTEPYLRVHQWWLHQKEYLKLKYYSTGMWKEIQKAYEVGKRPFSEPFIDIDKLPERSVELAKLLYQLIKKNNPNSIARECHIRMWADSIRLLNQRDGQSYDLIERVITACQKDDFWRKNILSGTKLRTHWDRLAMLLQGGKTDGPAKPQGKPGKYS